MFVHLASPTCPQLRRRLSILTLALSLTCGFTLAATGQQSSKTDRKVLVSVQPEYPEFIKRAQIGGLVRLRATVGAGGKVNFVSIIGGNPILAENAAAAVLKWRYAKAQIQTIEEVALNFNPH